MASSRSAGLVRHRRTGKLVSKRSKTGDPACSKAMSVWKTEGMNPDVAKTLGRCRSMARAHRQADLQRLGGHEGRAQHLEHRLRTGAPLGRQERHEIAKGVQVQRRHKAASRLARHGDKAGGMRAQAAVVRETKGTPEQRRSGLVARLAKSVSRQKATVSASVRKARDLKGKKGGADAKRAKEAAEKRLLALQRRLVRVRDGRPAPAFSLKQESAHGTVPTMGTKPTPREQAEAHRAKKGDRQSRLVRLEAKAKALLESATGRYKLSKAEAGRLEYADGRFRTKGWQGLDGEYYSREGDLPVSLRRRRHDRISAVRRVGPAEEKRRTGLAEAKSRRDSAKEARERERAEREEFLEIYTKRGVPASRSLDVAEFKFNQAFKAWKAGKAGTGQGPAKPPGAITPAPVTPEVMAKAAKPLPGFGKRPEGPSLTAGRTRTLNAPKPPKPAPGKVVQHAPETEARSVNERYAVGHKELGNVRFVPDAISRNEGHAVVWVDPKKVDRDWDRSKRVGHEGQGGIVEDYPEGRRNRYHRFGDFLGKAADEGTDSPVEMSRLTLDHLGRPAFENGRHRFAYLRDLGVSSVPVAVPKRHAEKVRKKYGGADLNSRKSPFSWKGKDYRDVSYQRGPRDA